MKILSLALATIAPLLLSANLDEAPSFFADAALNKATYNGQYLYQEEAVRSLEMEIQQLPRIYSSWEELN